MDENYRLLTICDKLIFIKTRDEVIYLYVMQIRRKKSSARDRAKVSSLWIDVCYGIVTKGAVCMGS